MWDNSVSSIQSDLSFGWSRLSLEHLSDTEHTRWLYAVSKLVMCWTKKAGSTRNRAGSSEDNPVYIGQQLEGGFNYAQR